LAAVAAPSIDSTPAGSLRSALAGFRLPLEGLGILWRERGLWPLAAVPLLLSLLAASAAVGIVIGWAPELFAWATAWMPELPVERWYQWLWLGPARAGLAAIGALLFVALAGACLVAAYLLASLLASPFHDALAARVERLCTGALVDHSHSGAKGIMKEGLRALSGEARRLVAFLCAVVPLALLGWIVPGGQLVTGPAIVAVSIAFLPLDYASYTLDRRHVVFAVRRRWLWRRRSETLGFGSAAFLTCLVPGLNLLAMPVLVVAGTLLVLRHGPGEAGVDA
jgi:uncharacterized protein involved in cysteine biosynthesis